MLEINENDRPSFKELKEALPDWSEVVGVKHNHI